VLKDIILLLKVQ